MIEARGLTYTVDDQGRPRTLLRDLNFSSEGARLAIIGPNGSGKSTLLRLLGGISDASEGSIRFGGNDRTVVPAYVPQRSEDGLWADLTVQESLRVAASRGRLLWSGHRGWTEARAALPWLPPLLENRLDARTNVLSGGEKQVLLLACALASAKSAGTGELCLLVDEFTGALDPRHEALARTALEEAVESLLSTGYLVLVTHSLAEAKQFSTDVLALQDGAVRWCRPTRELNAEMFLEAYEPALRADK